MDRIPILKMGDCLLVTIQVDMHDRLALNLQDDLTRRIGLERSRGVLIDISSLDIVDSFVGRMLGDIAATARVLDAAKGAVRLQSGYVYHYAFAMLIGATALVTWFLFYPPGN